jgi:hypothetical protein
MSRKGPFSFPVGFINPQGAYIIAILVAISTAAAMSDMIEEIVSR